MKVRILVSSSKGNATLIKCNNINILIDAGISYQKLKSNLDDDGLKGILITHVHKDHISGLTSIVKNLNVQVYVTKEIAIVLKTIIPIENITIIGDKFEIDSISVELLHTSHDVISYGYVIMHNDKSLVYITDTGYVNRKYFDRISNKKIYIIESNYDEIMLMEGPYPLVLKNRINSDIGHLSNKMTGKILSMIIGENTEYVFLAHVSEHNNSPELALQQVKEELKDIDFDFNKIVVANKYEITREVEV